MAVFRVERTRDYTVMCNHHLKDSNLSLKAKGLLSMMLSLPDEWNYTTRGLAAICKEGVDAIGKTLKELELAGYIIRRQLRGKDGRISDTEYTIFEKPRNRGFTMSVAFDSMWKTYTLTLKGQMTHRVELGSDARGNLVRIENALDKMPERLRSVQEQLENLYNQQAAAKAEVGKPFPQEQELAAKTARLIELDMELNLDGKGQPQPEQAIAKSTRPSVLDRLKAPPVHGAPEKPHKKEMEAR